MGRAPCCDKANVKKGPWSPEEDAKLREYIEKHGTGGNWIAFPQKAGLKRCGKSCRLRWLNYLRPNIKHGEFSDEEDRIICGLYANIGSRWSIIAAQLPGRTDNDIKNYWNTKLKKKLMILSPSLPQRKLHQAINTGFSSLLQATSLPSSPSTVLSSPSSSPYSYTLPRSFTEPIVPFSSSPLSSSNNSFTTSAPILQSQESFLSPSQQYQVKDSLLIFGGDQASCSSSDVSSNNQMMQAREIEYEYGGGGGGVENSTGHQQMGCQRYFCDGVEENRKSLLLSNRGGVHGWSSEKQNGLWGDNPVDYGLEEIKQLISTGGCTSFWFDENKADEKVMYH